MKLDKSTIPSFLWMSADRVVDRSLASIERNGAVAYVPGTLNKVIARAVRVLPHFVFRRGRRVGRPSEL
jgi:short-subunit dehydrogenase